MHFGGMENRGDVYDYSMVSWTHGVGRKSAREI